MIPYARKGCARLGKVDRREIFCQENVPNLQLVIEPANKSGADQIVELDTLVATVNPSCGRQKFSHALPANFFSNAGMKDLNGPVIDLTVNDPDAVAVGRRFLVQTTQEFLAFRWQSKRDSNHFLLEG